MANKNVETNMVTESNKYGDSFVKGIQSNESGVKSAAEKMRSLVVDTLSKSIKINVPINVTGTVTTSTKTTETKTDNNATGTTYFGGGLTTINEHGYEVVDLPQGTRIYPHSQSKKNDEHLSKCFCFHKCSRQYFRTWKCSGAYWWYGIKTPINNTKIDELFFNIEKYRNFSD